jgi:hypothetical protein
LGEFEIGSFGEGHVVEEESEDYVKEGDAKIRPLNVDEGGLSF